MPISQLQKGYLLNYNLGEGKEPLKSCLGYLTNMMLQAYKTNINMTKRISQLKDKTSII